MKSRYAGKLFAALLLIGFLTTSFESYALPPRQHAARGVIESIDHAKRTLVLVDPKTRTSRVFVWNDSTRFRQDGSRTVAEALQAGMEVKGYYRKEIGRFVLREVRWSAAKLRESDASSRQDFGNMRRESSAGKKP